MMFFDRLQNLVTGLGGAKDKRTSTSYALRIIDRTELDAMHRSDWLARKIVDIIPADMTREWRRWQAEKDQIEALEKEEKRLGLQFKVAEALQVARLYGGAGLVMGIGNEEPKEPLDLNRVGRGDLRYVHVMTRYELAAGGALIRDVESPWFGEPEYYHITLNSGQSMQVHPSRVVRFIGAKILNKDNTADGWGDSILQIVYDAVQNAASSQEHVAALVPEAKVDVIHVPGLSEHLSTTESTKRLTDRFTYAQTIKSLFGFTLLEGNGKDQGEVWQQKTINFSAFPDLLRQYLQVASGAADVPVTRLLGQSPAGLNSSGESDMRNYYDNIGARRGTELSYPLSRLDDVLIRSALGDRDDAIHYTWPSLWQPQPKEQAEISKLRAEATEKYVNMALVPDGALAKAVQNQLIESGDYPGLEGALEELGEESEDMDEPAPEESRRSSADARPRTLYVRRNVKNAEQILNWARAQGFDTTLKAEDLHVTVAYSRRPIDWMEVGEAWDGELKVSAGGPRLMEKFGEARVLLFGSRELEWRHDAIRRFGASWDHHDYQPHITISYSPDSPNLDDVEPYQGEIVLGPEIFEEIEEDWQAKIVEA